MSDTQRMFFETSRNLERTESYSMFAERHNIRSATILTVTDAETAVLIAERLAPRIEGKTVVEIGGGIGLLSLAMATTAERVFCIEANPMWAVYFTQTLLERKRKNISFLFGAADEFVGYIRADVAVICTHSDVEGMRLIGAQFAEVVDVYGEMVDENPDAFDPDARRMRLHT